MSDCERNTVSKKTNVLHSLLTKNTLSERGGETAAVPPSSVAVGAVPSSGVGVPALRTPGRRGGSWGLEAGTHLPVPLHRTPDQLPVRSHVHVLACL